MNSANPAASRPDPFEFGKVAVLLGGRSAEREISLMSGRAVLEALQGMGVRAEAFDPAERPLVDLGQYDRAFVMLHGRFGEDGAIQGSLELMGVPYTGSGVLASALGMDKWRTKLLWESADLPLPAYALLDGDSDFVSVEAKLGLPLFVKPCREGSSLGVTKVKNTNELASAYKVAAGYDPVVLAETAIGCAPVGDPGGDPSGGFGAGLSGEYTVAILDGEALPIIKIVPAAEFYDYEAKYFRDDTHYICPATLPSAQTTEIQRQALTAFHQLGCEGWGRVDFLMDEHGRHYWLEVNTLPGMTSHSLMPMAAAAAGIDFGPLTLAILSHSLNREPR